MPQTHPDPVLDLSTAHIRPIILNKPVLKEVENDTKKTVLPSWITSGPKELGNASHGTLSADEWRTICSVNLVITMVRLWGHPGASDREKALLDNFLALAAAVRWATKRTTSENHIRILEEQLQIYLNGVVALFSETALYPNHHISLHLAECIRNFGPVHGWWTFPFERYNGIIQRQKSNRKFGEHLTPYSHLLLIYFYIPGQLEVTFMKTFCRGGQLKALMSRTGIPDILDSLKPAFDRFFGSEFRGTLGNDLLALGAQGDVYQRPFWDTKKKSKDLSPATYNSLINCINRTSPQSFHSFLVQPPSPTAIALEPAVQYYNKLSAMGVKFSTASRSKGDAQILFRSQGDLNTILAGQIQEIFVHKRLGEDGTHINEYFLSVRKYKELSPAEAAFDPYRKYPLLDMRLCHDQLSSDITVISVDDVVSHFASCPFKMSENITGDLRVILSLDRVSTSLVKARALIYIVTLELINPNSKAIEMRLGSRA